MLCQLLLSTCARPRSVAARAASTAEPPAPQPSPPPPSPPPQRAMRAEPLMVSPVEAKALAARPVPVSVFEAFSLRKPDSQHASTPELMNGRAAMVGTLACLAAEVAGGGQSVVDQASAHAELVAAFLFLLTTASLVPVCRGVGPAPSTLGVFTPAAEARAARGLELAATSAVAHSSTPPGAKRPARHGRLRRLRRAGAGGRQLSFLAARVVDR